jgi:hypothetical protein
MTTPTCKSCRFWTASAKMAEDFPVAWGACRRMPRPETTSETDWCGEHQPREAAAEKREGRWNRLPGYYRIQRVRDQWEVAEWFARRWMVCGTTCTFQDDELVAIDERRIERSPP